MENSQGNPLGRRFGAWSAARPMDWRYAIRISLSALLAFALADLLRLPQPFWAVITAVIVARANLGGSLRAGADRLLATLAGALVGLLAALARPFGVPEFALLLAVVVPLALLAAARAEFRAALIAGLIVLEANSGNASPLAAALLRVGNITLGALIAILVSRFVLPTRAARISIEHCVRALADLSELLALVTRPPGSRSRVDIERVSARARRAWRAAGRTAWEARAEVKSAGHPGAAPYSIVRTLARLHSDIGLVGRTLGQLKGQPPQPGLAALLDEVASAFKSLTEDAGRALLQGESVPSTSGLDRALAAAPSLESAVATAALTQTLQVLRADAAELVALLARERTPAAA